MVNLAHRLKADSMYFQPLETLSVPDRKDDAGARRRVRPAAAATRGRARPRGGVEDRRQRRRAPARAAALLPQVRAGHPGDAAAARLPAAVVQPLHRRQRRRAPLLLLRRGERLQPRQPLRAALRAKSGTARSTAPCGGRPATESFPTSSAATASRTACATSSASPPCCPASCGLVLPRGNSPHEPPRHQDTKGTYTKRNGSSGKRSRRCRAQGSFDLGHGLLEPVYEACLVHELARRGLKMERQIVTNNTTDSLRLDIVLVLVVVLGRSDGDSRTLPRTAARRVGAHLGGALPAGAHLGSALYDKDEDDLKIRQVNCALCPSLLGVLVPWWLNSATNNGNGVADRGADRRGGAAVCGAGAEAALVRRAGDAAAAEPAVRRARPGDEGQPPAVRVAAAAAGCRRTARTPGCESPPPRSACSRSG